MINILEEKNIRMIWSKNGNEIWFHAGDVGEELGMTNIRVVLSNIDSDFKKKLSDSIVSKAYNRNFENSLHNTGEIFITEEAVYNMSFRSNKPEAKLFTKWVTSVLKQIRINGYYIATEKDEAWLGTRAKGKEARKIETDAIKLFVEYAKEQGSTNADRYYSIFSNMVRSVLGIDKRLKRDELPQDELLKILSIETSIGIYINKLMVANKPYKKIYIEVKSMMSTIYGLEDIAC